MFTGYLLGARVGDATGDTMVVDSFPLIYKWDQACSFNYEKKNIPQTYRLRILITLTYQISGDKVQFLNITQT